MKRIFFLGFISATAFIDSPADEWKLPIGEPQFRPGPGAEIAVGQCIICHSADYVSMQPPLDAAGWTAIVQKMREKYGAPLPAEQVETIVKYLTATYGKK